MLFIRQQITPVITLTLALCLIAVISAGCTRTGEPSAEMNAAQQSPSPLAAQPTPDITQITPPAETIVPVAPAGEVIDTSQLPDTLYGNTTDMSAPQFYDATTPATVTASGGRAAIVIVAEANLHTRPDAKSKTVGQVAKGATVRLNDQRRGAWFYVATGSGASGWIHGNDIKLTAAGAEPIGDGKSNGEKSDGVKAPRSKTIEADDTTTDDNSNGSNNAAKATPTPAKNSAAPKSPAQPPLQP